MPSPFDNAKLACTLKWEDDWVTAVAFVGGSKQLVAGNRLGGLLVWDLSSELSEKKPPLPERKPDAQTNAITPLASTPDGKPGGPAGLDPPLGLWEVAGPAGGAAKVVLD